jgi:hypothetical protein
VTGSPVSGVTSLPTELDLAVIWALSVEVAET